MIGCTIFQGSIVANVVEEVGGPVTSRAILSLLQAPGGVQALRSKKYQIVSVCILRPKIKVHSFTCKICQEIYQNLPEYDSLFFSICNQGKLHTMGTRYAECTRKVQYQVISQESLVTCPPNLLPKKALIEIQKFQVKCFDSSTEEHCSLINQFVRDCTVEILGGQLRLLMWIQPKAFRNNGLFPI